MERLLITNCRLFDAPSDERATSVLIEDGVIAQIGSADPCDNTLDGEGRIIAPGFIDVHIQGAGDADVLDGTVEALSAISQIILSGVNGYHRGDTWLRLHQLAWHSLIETDFHSLDIRISQDL